MPIADSPLEIWKHLTVKLAFNCLSTGTMAAMGRVAGNWMSWVSISNKKLVDRGIRLISELGGIPYKEAAERLFAADEWIESQDWTGKETPCAVQVALKGIYRTFCRRCGACCRIKDGIVRVGDAEIKRIAAFLGKSESSFIAEDTEVAPDRKSLMLKSRSDGSCVYLTDDNLCRIQSVKPDKCRTFPHEWTNPDSDTVCPALGQLRRETEGTRHGA